MRTYRVIGRYDHDIFTRDRPILLGFGFRTADAARTYARTEVNKPTSRAVRPCDETTVICDQTGEDVYTVRRDSRD